MIFVGIDDTDTLDSPGTNQLARYLVSRVDRDFACGLIVRHQLLVDPRVPCTSKNGSASILLEPRGTVALPELVAELRQGMREWFQEGSDPGLCVTERVPEAVTAFGQRCQRELVDQGEARDLAARCGVYLEGLGGTEGGVIGALAAVGLAATGNDGRVVQIRSWPDDLAGVQDAANVRRRGVDIRCAETGTTVTAGVVDVGKHLRPNYRAGGIVLFVVPESACPPGDQRWQALRFT